MRKFKDLRILLNLLVSLEDLSYAEEILRHLIQCSLIPDVACRLKKEIEVKKNKRQGVNLQIVDNGPK